MDSSKDAMTYHIPVALTVLSGIFLALGAIFAIVVAADVITRRGWRSMMGIMIPVYIINATYLGPVTLYLYYRFGRPQKPQPQSKRYQPKSSGSVSSDASVDPEMEKSAHACHAHQSTTASAEGSAGEEAFHEKPAHACHAHQSPATSTEGSAGAEASHEKDIPDCENNGPIEKKSCCKSKNPEPVEPPAPKQGCCKSQSTATEQTLPKPPEGSCCKKDVEQGPTMQDGPQHDTNSGESAHACCHSGPPRPTWATILIGVSHCGAGCVLGDLVGEWLVYGTGATINGHDIWAELLIDYAFALLFGIVFQYFSIAPMSGAWGPMTVWRAAKADVVSLTSFEVGAFGWMVAFQVGIFGYKLEMNTWLYWWMMQIGMALGACTGFPVNHYLIKYKIKEPCC